MCRSPSPRSRSGGGQGRPGQAQAQPHATARPSSPAAVPQDASNAAAAARGESAGTPSSGGGGAPVSAPADLVCGLQRSPKFLPCRFLYDDRGSQLYEAITALPEYYPYETEKRLLARHADAIASQLPAGSVVVELGCGDCSKTALLLQALMDRHGPAGVRFCGVDCSAEALRQTQRSLCRLVPALPQGQVELVEAEYLAGVRDARWRHPDAMLTILWLGSSVGNFNSGEAAELLGALHRAAGERCQLLLGADMWKDAGVLRRAYDDAQGVSSAFILNGMHHALATLGHPAATESAAELFGYEPVVNAERKQVEMWVRARRRLPDMLPGVHIEAGERVLVEISRKLTPEAVASMAAAAGLLPCATWGSPGTYCLTLLLTPAVALQRCWADSDSLFSAVDDWEAQPIELRHPFGFYYGHVAAFAKRRMLPQEPDSALDVMLSRGIDPLVHNPSQCHCHPAVPDSWPRRAQLAAYVARVREQLLAAVRQGVSGSAASSGAAGTAGTNGDCGGTAAAPVSMHALCMALEHERQHQETLCYMLAQQRKANAAAMAAGGPAVLGPPDSVGGLAADGAELALDAPADAVRPFYLQQCSYASASTANPSTAAAAPHAAAPAPVAPATPARTERQPGKPAPVAAATPARAECLPGKPGGLHQQERLPGELAQLPLPQERAGGLGPEEVPGGFVHIPAGTVSIGLDPVAERGFSWCCELGRSRPLAVAGLMLAPRPVTVAQFRRFVFEEQGYQRAELWEPDAYRHFSASGHSMPATWSLLPAGVCLPGGRAAATANGSAAAPNSRAGSPSCTGRPPQQHSPPPPQQQLWVHTPEGSYPGEGVAECPAYVSLAEAQAYARWAGGRLLTEAEYELALGSAEQPSPQLGPAVSGSVCAATAEAAEQSDGPAGCEAGGALGGGRVCQLESGGWEWTATPLCPLPGWRPDPLYPEYSADFFDGHHYVLRGSSPYTHPGAARRSFRNFFQSLYPYVFAKFRVAMDA